MLLFPNSVCVSRINLINLIFFFLVIFGVYLKLQLALC